MAKQLSLLKKSSLRYRNWLFPKVIALPHETTKLLYKLYPKVDWAQVIFHDGIPWFSFYSITLPGFLDQSNIHIYLKRYQPLEYNSLSTIVHEAFHVQQYTDLNPKGFGFYRNFISQYLGLSLRYGYRKHPMEIPAYHTESLFRAQYRAYRSSGLVLQDIPWSAPFPILHSGVKRNPFSFLYVLGALLAIIITPVLPLVYFILGTIDISLGFISRRYF